MDYRRDCFLAERIKDCMFTNVCTYLFVCLLNSLKKKKRVEQEIWHDAWKYGVHQHYTQSWEEETSSYDLGQERNMMQISWRYSLA